MKPEDTVRVILKESDRLAGNLANDTEGNFKPEDMEAIWFKGSMAIYQAGIWEVFDWFMANGYSGGAIHYADGVKARFDPPWDELQAKRKEWGIKEKKL